MRTEGQKQSRKHEDRLAKAVGGSRRPASGAFELAKGDVREQRSGTGDSYSSLLIEHKWTGQKQIAIKASVLEKISMEALLESRIPVLGISLNNNDYVLLTEHHFMEIRNELERLREQVRLAEAGEVPGGI